MWVSSGDYTHLRADGNSKMDAITVKIESNTTVIVLATFLLRQCSLLLLLLLLLFTRSFPRDGGMAEDHGAPEAKKLPRIWTRVRRDREKVASVPQSEQLARTPQPPLQKGKGKEPSVQSTRS